MPVLNIVIRVAALASAVMALILLQPASASSTTASTPEPAEFGAWSEPQKWPVTGIHAALLPTGDVLHFAYPFEGEGSEAWLWNAASGQREEVPIDRDLFCAGHAFLPDGSLIVFGGNDERSRDPDFFGTSDVHRFDPYAKMWTRLDDMAHGRWYPTATALADGRLLVASGLDVFGGTTPVLEVFTDGTGMTVVPDADKYLDLYPRNFLLPSGEVLHSGPEGVADVLNLGTGEWREVDTNSGGWRGDGTSVLLPLRPPAYTPVVMAIGGDDPGKSSVELLDADDDDPEWATAEPMTYARRHANSTLLPDGSVLVSGGTAVNNEPANAVLPAELYNPATGEWQIVASLHEPRLYHSTALLLPDGRVLTTGGDGELTGEIYSPPYLFRGERPTISGAPNAAAYDSTFTVLTDDAADVEEAVLIRLSSVTHSFNQEQRLIELEFEAGSGQLAVQAPQDGNITPPGYYMLFLLNGNGVPSEARFIRIGIDSPGGVRGDTNCDSQANGRDALNLFAFVAGEGPSPTGVCPLIGSGAPVFGDMDCDGDVDIDDGLALLRHTAGIPSEHITGCEPIGT